MPFLWPVLVMIVIYLFSAAPAETSDQHSGIIVDVVRNVFPNATDIHLITTIVRKIAHFTEYLILGLLFARALNVTSERERTADYRKEHEKTIKKRIILYAAALSLIVAAGDETHQLFVPGRAGKFSDILIDLLGAAAGIAIYCTFKHLRSRKAKNTQETRK